MRSGCGGWRDPCAAHHGWSCRRASADRAELAGVLAVLELPLVRPVPIGPGAGDDEADAGGGHRGHQTGACAAAVVLDPQLERPSGLREPDVVLNGPAAVAGVRLVKVKQVVHGGAPLSEGKESPA